MDTGARTFLLVGFGVIGIAPLVLVGFWFLELRRRRASEGQGASDGGRRFGPLEIGFIVVALVALTAGAYAYVERNPELQQEDHSEHEGSADPAVEGGDPDVVPVSSSQEEFPTTLAGLDRTELVVGAEALEQVSHLHQGATIEITSAVIARYGGPAGRAELWLARAGDADAASALANDMARRMATSESPFEVPVPAAGENQMWETRGMGQVHRFWAAGTGVWWLSIDEPLLPAALSEAKALSGS